MCIYDTCLFCEAPSKRRCHSSMLSLLPAIILSSSPIAALPDSFLYRYLLSPLSNCLCTVVFPHNLIRSHVFSLNVWTRAGAWWDAIREKSIPAPLAYINSPSIPFFLPTGDMPRCSMSAFLHRRNSASDSSESCCSQEIPRLGSVVSSPLEDTACRFFSWNILYFG